MLREWKTYSAHLAWYRPVRPVVLVSACWARAQEGLGVISFPPTRTRAGRARTVNYLPARSRAGRAWVVNYLPARPREGQGPLTCRLLTGAEENRIEHLGGHPAGERVLLTGVVAAQEEHRARRRGRVWRRG